MRLPALCSDGRRFQFLEILVMILQHSRPTMALLDESVCANPIVALVTVVMNNSRFSWLYRMDSTLLLSYKLQIELIIFIAINISVE